MSLNLGADHVAPANDALRFATAYTALDAWLDEHGLEGPDVCDVRAHPLFLAAHRAGLRGGVGRVPARLARSLEARARGPLRRALRIPGRRYPQAMGLMARAWLAAPYAGTADSTIPGEGATSTATGIAKATRALTWLVDHPSPGYPWPCWGQPYDWPTRDLIVPRDTPRATVTSIIVQALCDGFEATGDVRGRDQAVAACGLFVEGLHHHVDADGDVCMSYTTVDEYCVHNASVLAAAAILRAEGLCDAPDAARVDLARAAIRYTRKHQRDDGSWFYWGPPSAILGRVDGYHTGFVLESLFDALPFLPEDEAAATRTAIERGVAHFLAHLLDPDDAPRYTVAARYPLDVQSAAQAVLTLARLAEIQPALHARAEDVADWSLAHLANGDGSFATRIDARGRIDRTPYLRWGQSWMLRALALLCPAPDSADALSETSRPSGSISRELGS